MITSPMPSTSTTGPWGDFINNSRFKVPAVAIWSSSDANVETSVIRLLLSSSILSEGGGRVGAKNQPTRSVTAPRLERWQGTLAKNGTSGDQSRYSRRLG